MSKKEKVEKELSVIEKYLTFWIFLAIIFGVVLGYVFPQTGEIIGSLSVGTTSIGLILMILMIILLSQK